MKKNWCFFLVIFFFCTHFVQAQEEETEFWLTFGKNRGYPLLSLNLQIRILSEDKPCQGTIFFSNIGTSVPFKVDPPGVFVHNLSDAEILAVINTSAGKNNKSIRIKSNNPVTVYAMNQIKTSTDVTNILPVSVLGTDYRHISYTPNTTFLDAYAVVATLNSTNVWYNGELKETLNEGQVYYSTSATDMTGAHITTDKPVAFFALGQGVQIPDNYCCVDNIMQQLIPVSLWDTCYFAPASPNAHDIVRIVASQNNTNIKQTGGELLSPLGGQTNLNNLMAGDFVELKIPANSKGCYIRAEKPVGVCTYLSGGTYNKQVPGNKYSDPAQSWLPSVNQMVFSAFVTPPVPAGTTGLKEHFAIVISPSETKNSTQVSVNGAPATNLSGGSWIDNEDAGISFYRMPLKNLSALYNFTNLNGLSVLSSGIGDDESYYFNTFFARTNSTFVSFTANDISYYYWAENVFCSNIVFRAETSQTPISVKWFIDNQEVLSAQNKLTWDTTLLVGNYTIRMEVKLAIGEPVSLESKLSVGVPVSATAFPPEGGRVEGTRCYLIGETAHLKAIPNTGYVFTKWTEDDNFVSSDTLLDFSVTDSRNLVAHFTQQKFNIIVSAKPPEGGEVSKSQYGVPHGTEIKVSATANPKYTFVSWEENGYFLTASDSYTFTVTKDRNLTATFRKGFTLTVDVNDSDYGTATGEGVYEPNTYVKIQAFANECHPFINWTINNEELSTENPYRFTIREDMNIVANFRALDFDTFARVLWDNTFMLHLRKLQEGGYQYTGCLWYKNGVEEPDTRTINNFSYSAGPYESDLLELAPTYYSFKLRTKNFGNVCSSKKTIDSYQFTNKLLAYPNPVLMGGQLTIAGLPPNSTLYIYNQYGACVGTTMVTENTTTLTLNYSPGIYLIRSNNKTTKILIVR